jgi:hypothetical protein
MKKSFKTAAENFISGAEEEPREEPKKAPAKKAQAKKPKEEQTAPAVSIPKGYRLEKELKSERLQLLIRPTTKQALKDKAAKEGVSVNDLINRILDDYTEKGR